MSTTRSRARIAAVCATTLCLAGAGTLQARAASPSPSPSSSSTVSALDRQLLTAAHQGNLWEITTGLQAQRAASSYCVKRLGAIFVRDHRALEFGVLATAARVGVTLPSGQTAAQIKQTAALKAITKASAYDAAWIKAEHTAHVQTLALIDKEIASGTNPQVKALARAARPVVAWHTSMVNGSTCRAPGSKHSRG